jgi:hypothetical protein
MAINTPTATNNRPDAGSYGTDVQRSHARQSTETKASFKTTELIAYVVAVVGVLVASQLVKTTAGHADYFRADKAWFYIVLLTIGYLGSRGLAKSGSHDNYDA